MHTAQKHNEYEREFFKTEIELVFGEKIGWFLVAASSVWALAQDLKAFTATAICIVFVYCIKFKLRNFRWQVEDYYKRKNKERVLVG